LSCSFIDSDSFLKQVFLTSHLGNLTSEPFPARPVGKLSDIATETISISQNTNLVQSYLGIQYNTTSI